jgi:hypothetical protein
VLEGAFGSRLVGLIWMGTVGSFGLLIVVVIGVSSMSTGTMCTGTMGSQTMGTGTTSAGEAVLFAVGPKVWGGSCRVWCYSMVRLCGRMTPRTKMVGGCRLIGIKVMG